jgi:hypothetical protein
LIWETYPGGDNVVTDGGGVVGDGSGKELVVTVSVKKMLCPSELVVGVIKTSLQTVVKVARVTSTVKGEEAVVEVKLVDVSNISGMVAVTVVLPVIEIDVSVIVDTPVPGTAPLQTATIMQMRIQKISIVTSRAVQ